MMRFVCLLLVARSVQALLTTAAAAARPPEAQHVSSVYGKLLTASRLLDPDGRATLSHVDINTALDDMHLEGTSFAPAVVAGEVVDVTELVTATLPTVLAAHPAFLYMAEQTVGNDDFFESVYFGTEPRGPDALDFCALSRRLVASIYLFELLLAQDRDAHRSLAQHYENRYAEAVELRAASPESYAAPRSVRDVLMRFFLAVKGESVLASINSFESMRRAAAVNDATEVSRLSGVANGIMDLNLLEAILSNLSFAYWPDNARAGMALLLSPLPPFGADLSQPLDKDWFELYLAWNANFIWPSHENDDMMCFSMLLAPTISLGSPTTFQYLRAHSLFWVVRSTQLTRMRRDAERAAAAAGGEQPEASEQVRCFRCRQLEPMDDRQPLTSRTAVRTRASGEALARARGEDVSEGSGVWWRLFTQVVPQQARSLVSVYRAMPKASPTKLRLL